MEETRGPEPIRIIFAYTREEYVCGMRLCLRKSHVVSWVQALFLIIALAAMAMIMVLQWPSAFSVLNIFVLVLLLLVSLYGIFIYAVKPRRVYDKTPKLSQEVRFTFSMENIARQDQDEAAFLEWNVVKFWRCPMFYFLFEGKDTYLMLPRRAFTSEQDRRDFERLVLTANPGLAIKDYG